MKTPDEINDEIRARVNQEIPRPIGGFETESDEDAFRFAQDKRFLELCREHAQGAETQHTPGPWRVGKSCGSVVSDHPVPEINGSGEIEYYGGHLIAESISPANARLIAAAPELLEALKMAMMVIAENHCPHTPERGEIFGQCQDALKKAEGRAEK